ncbi:arsenate reductase family protein [Gaetbulibacter aestuarii]|uniref:Arsenate reductase n=1 Tax=Gaetbulibacter aestuarii TaxID=1502358 RepID=A0ABW7MVH7_9FLAO
MSNKKQEKENKIKEEKIMSVLARNKRQLTYIYSSDSFLGKKVLGYVQAVKKPVEIIDISKTKLSDTAWVEIAEELNMSFEDIFNTEMVTDDNKQDFDNKDWIKMVQKNPALLHHPIAINAKDIMLVSNRAEILKLFEVDSAGLEKSFYDEEPVTSSTTKGEKFI